MESSFYASAILNDDNNSELNVKHGTMNYRSIHLYQTHIHYLVIKLKLNIVYVTITI